MKKKPTKAEEVFTKFITLYDICDELKNSGDDKAAKKMRKTLDDIGTFLASLMFKNN
jgi:hypothetical protein